MPIYEYRCQKCGSHIEVIQKLSDPPLKRCAKCRGKLEKVVSRTSFQLKGSGWYATDYSRKDGAASKDKTEKGSDKPEKGGDRTEKGTEKKSESVSKTTASRDTD
jgi:putative FmdB family regulatory protein